MEDGVREDHFNRFSRVETDSETEVLQHIKTVAVRRANRAVDRDQLGRLRQEGGEPVRKFAGRVRTLACVAEYQVIGGLMDRDIKTDVLSHEEVNTWSLNSAKKAEAPKHNICQKVLRCPSAIMDFLPFLESLDLCLGLSQSILS